MNVIVPLFLLLFLIVTLSPILSEIEFSKSLKFASLEMIALVFLFLNIFTKFSDCLTDNFFSIILFATKRAFSRPT